MRAAPRAANAWPSKGRIQPRRLQVAGSGLRGMRRLQTRAQFQAALSGSTVARTTHFALHRCTLDVPAGEPGAFLFHPHEVWLGALVPKRWARRAVTRNSIRRQIYAVSSAHAATLPAAAHVVRLRAGFDRQQFVSATSSLLKQAVRGELQQLFARAARATAA
jgi:ribonuclease P protein component